MENRRHSLEDGIRRKIIDALNRYYSVKDKDTLRKRFAEIYNILDKEYRNIESKFNEIKKIDSELEKLYKEQQKIIQGFRDFNIIKLFNYYVIPQDDSLRIAGIDPKSSLEERMMKLEVNLIVPYNIGIKKPGTASFYIIINAEDRNSEGYVFNMRIRIPYITLKDETEVHLKDLEGKVPEAQLKMYRLQKEVQIAGLENLIEMIIQIPGIIQEAYNKLQK